MNLPPPRAELAKAELATLTQLLFHLHAAVGATAPAFPLDELLRPFPGLAAEDRQRLRDSFSTLPPPDDGPGHPGLRPLLETDDDSNTITLAEGDSLKTTLSPYLLHDTFVVDLTTAWQDPSLSSLRSAAPQTPQTSLRTCGILYLKLHDTASFSAASAATYLSAVSGHDLVFRDEATLLGRRIWEFSDGRCPWFVWLDDVDAPIEKEIETEKLDGSEKLDGLYQQHLVNLLCCRAKIDFAARESRRSFAKGFQIYQEIEAWASQIAPLDSEWPSQVAPLRVV